MLKIRARVWDASVTIPICAPVREIAGCPAACSAMLNRAIDTCSPVESSISISRRLGWSLISRARATSPSVVLPMAETTTTTEFPAFTVSITRAATD